MLGALTTFSNFTRDADQLWQTKEVIMAAVYVVLPFVLSMAALGVMFVAVRHSGIWH